MDDEVDVLGSTSQIVRTVSKAALNSNTMVSAVSVLDVKHWDVRCTKS